MKMYFLNNKIINKFFLLCTFIIFHFFNINAATCTPTSAILCINGDDDTSVWINGNYVGAFPYVNWDAPGFPLCVNVPVAWLNATGDNVIAMAVTDTAGGQIWGSFTLDVTCSGGQHAYISSNSGNMKLSYTNIYNSPPPNDGSGNAWYTLNYNDASWGYAVQVGVTTWAKPLYDPADGRMVKAWSYSNDASSGANQWDPSGQKMLYFRRHFTLNPVTPLPSPTFTIQKSTPQSSMIRGGPVTFTIVVCVSGGYTRDPVLITDWWTSPTYCAWTMGNPYYYNDINDGIMYRSDTTPDRFTLYFPLGFEANTCKTFVYELNPCWFSTDWYSPAWCTTATNYARVTWTSGTLTTSLNVQLYCPSPSNTATRTRTATLSPTYTRTNTPQITPTPTPSRTLTSTYTRTRTPTPFSSPTRTSTPTYSRTLTPSPSRTPTPSPSRTPTSSPSRTPTQTWTRTPSPSVSPSASATRTPTPSSSRTPTPTWTRTPSPSLTNTNTRTRTPTFTYTDTISSNTPTITPTWTRTGTRTPTLTYTRTRTPTLTWTNTVLPSSTNTRTPTSTYSRTPSLSPTNTNTRTRTPTFTYTDTISSNTQTITSTHTRTNTRAPTLTWTNTVSPSPTNTRTPTLTYSRTPSPSITNTNTRTRTPTFTYTDTISSNTPTITPTWTRTGTETSTATSTNTPSLIATPSDTWTQTFTPTYSNTLTNTQINTPTFTFTDTISSNTPTMTMTWTNTRIQTSILTVTPTWTMTCSPTFTQTASPTGTNTVTVTLTVTDTSQNTATNTPTVTYTLTITSTWTITQTDTPTWTETLTSTWTSTSTVSYTFTGTPTWRPTQTITPTVTNTPDAHSAELTIMLLSYGENAQPGGIIEYKIIIENKDSNVSAYNIKVWDTLPSELEFLDSYFVVKPVVENGVVIWQLPEDLELKPGERIIIEYRVKMNNIDGQGFITNIVYTDYQDAYYNDTFNNGRHPVITSNINEYPEEPIIAYPNPYKISNENKGIKFVNLPPNCSIQIYTLSGESVVSLNIFTGSRVVWDGKNRKGREVSPGIYYYVVFNKYSKQVVREKIFVIE